MGLEMWDPWDGPPNKWVSRLAYWAQFSEDHLECWLLNTDDENEKAFVQEEIERRRSISQ
jgi:hypothetical protein